MPCLELEGHWRFCSLKPFLELDGHGCFCLTTRVCCRVARKKSSHAASTLRAAKGVIFHAACTSPAVLQARRSAPATPEARNASAGPHRSLKARSSASWSTPRKPFAPGEAGSARLAALLLQIQRLDRPGAARNIYPSCPTTSGRCGEASSLLHSSQKSKRLRGDTG